MGRWIRGNRVKQCWGVLPVDEDPSGAVADPQVAAEWEGWAPPSWEEIVQTHSARIYRLAYRLTGNQHDAEDLTQEVFVRVFRSLSTYTPGTFQGWLHRITTNLFLDQARRKQRIRFDALPDDASDRLAGSGPTPSQDFDDRHFDGDVQTALDDLAPEFRATVVLCDIEGLSYEEIAATLGVKLGTVRSRIHRGRAQLRASLQHRIPRHGVRRNPEPEVASGGPALSPGQSAEPARRDRLAREAPVMAMSGSSSEEAATA